MPNHQPAPPKPVSLQEARGAAQKLLAYCEAHQWAGHDPYDALNSRLFETLPLLDFKVFRIALTQALKRSPVNLRRFLLVPETQNAKAIGLFLSACLNLSQMGIVQDDTIEALIGRLIALRAPDSAYWCWGYNFPWQMRTKVVPRGAPNLVCTAFAANALLDAYEQRHDFRCLEMAFSAARYIFDTLYWTEGSMAGFSYPLPELRGQVHNASFLAAALLCRVAHHTGEKKFLAPALRVARYAAAQQHADGSWDYGEAPKQRWVDNFHTGFNLCAMQSIGRYAKTAEFEASLRHGFEYYRTRFFREDGAARYFSDRTYPIDIHAVAQSLITLMALRDLHSGSVAEAHKVYRWATKHMWDDRGFFYYRVLRTCTIRTSYMRWSQAWMLLAISMVLLEMKQPAKLFKLVFELGLPANPVVSHRAAEMTERR